MRAKRRSNRWRVYTTMAASRKRPKSESDNRGQSVLEFLFMLPIMVALTMMLVKVNTAIQVSIVNQQYARAQALWLTFNSPIYPALVSRMANFLPRAFNQMIIGVSDNLAVPTGYEPKAMEQKINRTRGPAGSEE